MNTNSQERRPMNRRRWIVIAIAVALLFGGGAGLIFFVTRDTGVTKANYSQLQFGMEKHEVRAIFGGRPYDSHFNQERWIGYDGCVTLTYDEHEKLVWREWESSPYRRRFPDNIWGSIQGAID